MLLLFTLIFFLGRSVLQAQESVFSALSQSLVDADKAVIAKNYGKALAIYEQIADQNEVPDNIDLRLARSYYFTFQYEKATKYYAQYEKTNLEFPTDDYFYFAEALSAIGLKDQALPYYQICLDKKPNYELYAGRIWRLNNLSYLYEDSIKNMAHRAKMNTSHSELQMVQTAGNEVILVSNQPQVALVRKIDTKENATFYKLNRLNTYEDPFSIVALNYESFEPLAGSLKTPFHIAAISLFDEGKQMIYAASSRQRNEKGNYSLQLFFAKMKKGRWVNVDEYEHNKPNFDMSEPAISPDGKTLIFSANLSNGVGLKDLYISVKTEEGWSQPENMGNTINTELDERFPFIHQSNLYFSSNGHPGLGGFDLYKAKLIDGKYQELENLGYPVNSTYDDLSFSVDSLGQQGFLSSNRKNKGFDFDIYEFALDLQVYPLTVDGIVKFIEHNWMDSSELKILPNVKMELIDRTGNKVVGQTKTDGRGNFQLNIPYYSQYKIRIKGDDLDGFVSFDVPKFAKQDLSYEIVVVNDDFKNSLRD